MKTQTMTPEVGPVAGDSVSEAEYRRLALGDGGRWELHAGRLREKPAMSNVHGDIMFELAHELRLQVDPSTYRLRVGHARLRRSAHHYLIPDIAVIPTSLTRELGSSPQALDAYAEPLPLVVEVWSPSTGSYDIQSKIPEYRMRGDEEIWLLHPYARTLHVWRRRADGGYDEGLYEGGFVPIASLPGVAIDLDALFAAVPPDAE